MNSQQLNAYSRKWFEFFHVWIDQARTNKETEFIRAWAPLPQFRRLLDVCCGTGRHARALASEDYSVTGIDRDPHAITKARQLGDGPHYLVADIRDYQPEAKTFDAIIIMGQSFGHFDATTNREVLGQLAAGLREGGRIILDLWNREFFVAHQGTRELNTEKGIVRESKRVESDRLLVHLQYPDGVNEKFEWQLFTPEEMEQLAKAVGLRLLAECSGFDLKKPPSPADPRLQFVLQTA